MNIDELTEEIRLVSKERVVQRLADLLQEWKQNEKNAIELKDTIERYIGNAWIEKEKDHKKIYQMWSTFRDTAITDIGGMTVNERLYWFGLFEMYDRAKDTNGKKKIYNKIMAKI